MANQFVLTAQIMLQAPANARQTLSQIQRQLQGGINVSVNLNSNSSQIKSLNQQLNSVNQSAKAASNSVSELGKTIGAAARRFGAISLATGTFLSLTRSIKNSIGDAIEFERQMVVLAQTTEKSVRELGDLYREVTRLSTGLGVSSDGLIKTSIVLAQAGLEARKAKGALEVLAKTQLAASFDDIQSTTEGAIAILAQFRREAAGAGGDIKFLETSLEAINQVSKKYAVESSDLIAVIRRSGGAFEAAGGSLNELLALFTSVRATTRESAETISTGLRTIFTRIQRADTIAQLKELGITLQDLEGKFVGPFEAIKRISEGLASLDPRDIRFAQIVEELGGFRQIGKVIPLIKQFTLAQEALNTAQQSSGSLTRDTETAQLSLANKIAKVKEEFQALVRDFSQSEGFQSVAKGALEFARALIRIADAIEPLLPLIASLGAIQVGRGLASALGAFSGFTRKNSGGKIMAFASGGMVPGTGNRDTVPAMLSPGEFVIRKSSAKKIGAENLQRLNSGGTVKTSEFSSGSLDSSAQGAISLRKKISGYKNWQPNDDLYINYNVEEIDPLTTKDEVLKQEYIKNKVVGNGKLAGEAFEKIVGKRVGKIPTPSNDFLDFPYGEAKSDKNWNNPLNTKKYRSLLAKAFNTFNSYTNGFTPSYDKLSATSKPITLYIDKLRSPANKEKLRKSYPEYLQKLNQGGIVDQNTVGALILKPGKDVSSAGIQVTNADIEKKAKKQKRNINSKVFPGNIKSYELARSGIKDDTFLDSLNKGIDQGLTDAVQLASNRVSGLLGLPNAGIDPEQSKKLSKSINPGARATLFEEVIANISRNSGGELYDNRTADAPFDFVGSIGKAADLFENQEAAKTKYKDAKASMDAARPVEFVGKIANQIVKEEPVSMAAQQQKVEQFNDLKGQFFSGKNELREFLVKKGLASQNSVKGQGLDDWLAKNNLNPIKTLTGAGGSKDAASYKFAKGGAAPSDTVPALLTPGEFVVKKSTAQKVGYGALSRMNKTGEVQGYANGGAVGMAKGGSQNSAKEKYKAQRSAERKQATLAQQGLLFTPEDQIDFTKLGGAQRQATKTTGQGGQGESRAAGSIVPGTGVSAASPVLAASKLTTEMVIELGKRADALGLDYEAGAVLEKKYLQQRKLGLSREEAYQKAQEAATTNLKNRTKEQKKETKETKVVGINTEAIQRVAQSAQNFIYLAGGAATLASQFSSLDEASKEAITQTIAFGVTLAGAAGTVADFGINIARSLPASAKESIAQGLGKGLGKLAPLIMSPLGIAAGAAAVALGGFALYIYYMQAKAKAVADGLNKQAEAIAQGIEQGKGGDTQKYINLQVQAAKTLTDSYVTLGGSLDYLGITSSKARQAEIDAVRNSASSFIGLVATIADTDKALAEIAADKGLNAQERVTKSVKALETGDITGRKASVNLEELLTRTKTLKTPSSVNESDFKLQTDKIAFKNIQGEFTKFYEEAQKRKSQLANLVQGSFEEAMSKTDYNKLATSDLNFDGVVDGFDSIIEQNKEFESSYRSARDQILKINEEEVRMLKSQGKIFEATMKESEGQKQVSNLEESMVRQTKANQKATASTLALEKAMASSYATGVATRKTTDYIYSLGQASKDSESKLSGLSSMISGELFNIQIPEIPDMKNLSAFSNAVNKLGDSLGPQGQEMAAQVTGVAALMEKAKLELSNINFAQISGTVEGGAQAAMKKAFGGGELEKLFGPELGSEISAALAAEIQGAIDLGSEGKGRITDQEFEKIADRLEPFIGDTKEFFTQYNSILAQNIETYQAYSTALAAQIKAAADGQQKLVDVSNRGAERMEEATGKSNFVTSGTKIARRTQSGDARLGTVGFGGMAANVGSLSSNLQRVNKELEDNVNQMKKDGRSSTLLRDKNRELTSQANELKTALEKLADQSENASDIMSDIAKERGKREFGKDTLKSLITGSQEERMGVMKQFAGVQQAMAQGTFQRMQPEDQKASFALLERLAEVDTTGGYKAILDQLTYNDATMLNVAPEIVKGLLTSTTQEQVLLGQLAAINAEERNAQQALNDIIKNNQDALNKELNNLATSISDLPKNIAEELKTQRDEATKKQEADKTAANDAAEKRKREEAITAPRIAAEERLKKNQEQEALAKKTMEASRAQLAFTSNAVSQAGTTANSEDNPLFGMWADTEYNEIAGTAILEANALTVATERWIELKKEQKRIQDELNISIKRENELRASEGAPQIQAQTKSMGGVIYASKGAYMKPKGTDTVPAMLTPGEFVMRKSSVDKYGTGMMKAINNGQYMADGGSAGNNPYYDPDWLDKRFKEKNPGVDSYKEYRKNVEREEYGSHLGSTISGYESTDNILRKRERRREDDGTNDRDQEIARSNIEFDSSQMRSRALTDIGQKMINTYDLGRKMKGVGPDGYDLNKTTGIRGDLTESEQIGWNLLHDKKENTGNVINSKGFIKNITGRGSSEQVKERQKQIQQQQRFGGGAMYNDPINNTLRGLISPAQQQAQVGTQSPQEQVRQNQLRIQSQQRGIPSQNVYNPMNSAAPAQAPRGQAPAQGGFDGAMNGFKEFGQQIIEAAKLLNGMTMNHTMTINGSINTNSAEVAEAVKKAVGEFVTDTINTILGKPRGLTASGSTPKR